MNSFSTTGTKCYIDLCILLLLLGGAVYSSKHPDNLGVATNEVLVFDPVSRNWYHAASMIYSRAYAAVLVWKKQLLVVGGEDSAKQSVCCRVFINGSLFMFRANYKLRSHACECLPVEAGAVRCI